VNKFIADTMAFVLWLEKRKMPKKIKEIFHQAENQQTEIILPAMVFAELAYLSEGGKIDTNLTQTRSALEKYPNITERSMTLRTVAEAFVIDDIPELHDKLIAADGNTLNYSVITNDLDIQGSRFVETIWK